MKYILDTDIGDDIDDSFCLALLAKYSDLIAVTTVFRNTKMRAYQAAELLNSLNRNDVPVYVGEGIPISNKMPLFHMETEESINNIPCQFDEDMKRFKIHEGAIDEIIKLIHENPHDISVCTIGASTNLALAIEKDPSIVPLISCVYQMGGHFAVPNTEWNVICDPKAVDIIWKSDVPKVICPLDVTLKCFIDNDFMDKVSSSELPHNKLIMKWLKRWEDYFHWERSVMHDPLALSIALGADACTLTPKWVKVSLEEDKTFGVTYWSDHECEGYSKALVATEVDREKFFSFLGNKLL